MDNQSKANFNKLQIIKQTIIKTSKLKEAQLVMAKKQQA